MRSRIRNYWVSL